MTQNNFYNFESSDELNSLLSEIDNQRIRINLKKQKISKNFQGVLHEKLQLEWTYNSNAIEGSTLSKRYPFLFNIKGLQ